MGKYLTAQICLSGHLIAGDISDEKNSENSEKFCHLCGSETITSCLNCGASIRGYYTGDECGVLYMPMNVPAFCRECGEPYPWTEDALETASAVIDEENNLGKEDKEKLKKSLPDLISETPKTPLAVVLFKKTVSVAGNLTKSALLDFAQNSACEAVKKLLGL